MDTIREEYRDILVRFARVMKNHPGLKVMIEGHTDNVGNAESNLELSRKRAESVKSFLVSEGIDASRIATMGYGQSRPVADNASEQGRERNRRVEAEVEYEKTPSEEGQMTSLLISTHPCGPLRMNRRESCPAHTARDSGRDRANRRHAENSGSETASQLFSGQGSSLESIHVPIGLCKTIDRKILLCAGSRGGAHD